MVASLPPNIQLKLDQTLQQWRQWRCDPPLPNRPRAVSRFTSGFSNYSVLVEARQYFVIRIDGAHIAGNGLSRATEWRGLSNAHKAGLAPCPRYNNPELGALVCDFLPSGEAHTENLPATARLLRDIHNLPALHHRLDLRDRILSYERQLTHNQQTLPGIMASCGETVLTRVNDMAHWEEPSVLCHNDLLAPNRVYSDGVLKAIDWEYCAMGSPWFDLAVVVVGDKLDTIQKQQLVEAYLGRTATPAEGLKLAQCCFIYQYLELLWHLTNLPPKHDLGDRLASLQHNYHQLGKH